LGGWWSTYVSWSLKRIGEGRGDQERSRIEMAVRKGTKIGTRAEAVEGDNVAGEGVAEVGTVMMTGEVGAGGGVGAGEETDAEESLEDTEKMREVVIWR
jgi:hypothetical protein